MNITLSQRTIIQNGKIYDAIDQSWYTFLEGHNLTVISNQLDQDFDKIAENTDVLIVTGGDNSPVRRRTERRAIVAMLKRNKRIVGVCHGAFLLTKFLGGTTGRKSGHKEVIHKVIHNGCEHFVNSNHRNYIKTLPSSATVVAVDQEGHCEAWVDHNIAGIVWHPENMNPAWIPDEIASFFGKNSLTL
jgi:gamma-glutamyl-gamma-aminobutyrate hydrolase PuuD